MWAGCASVAILLVSMIAFQPDISRHQIQYRCLHKGEKLSENDTGELADILRKRLVALEERLGLKDIGVFHSGTLVEIRFSTRKDVDEILFWITMPGRVTLALLHPDIRQPLEQPVGKLPSGYEEKVYTQYMYRLTRPGDLKADERKYVVTSRPLMEINKFKLVDFAKVGIHSRTELTFEFNDKKAEQFHHITALNYGRRMAMLVDGRLFFPPKKIGGAVDGGIVQVAGYFYNPPLRKLVKVLNTGALPGELQKVRHQIY